uniref:Nucleoporin NUP42 n=1 Tax=Hippocampus comes TaxID=109280 RepID=A0A3Q3D4G5_HIPCM
MSVCHFFLQGRCRYGDKCWNEHPRGGARTLGTGTPLPSHSHAFGNKVWVNPSQQKGGFNQQQPSRGSDQWAGRSQDVKSSDFSFSSQNRFSALTTVSGEEDDEQKLEVIQNDMKTLENSGQWGFSCYCTFKTHISGFTDLSPEELRLEYYSAKASGDLQSYLNGVNLLLNQWRSRVQELLLMKPATRALAELKNPSSPVSSSDFGSTASGFGSSSFGLGSKGNNPIVPISLFFLNVGFGEAPVQASTFSFASLEGGFGSSAAPTSTPSFGSAISVPTGFGATSSSSGFGSGAPSAASFSFGSPPSNQLAASSSGFGSAACFSFSSTANNNKATFGSGFGSKAPVGSLFGQSSSSTGSAGGASDTLFSPESDLTPEELDQFKAQKFTLGQIPLKPPPAQMLRL